MKIIAGKNCTGKTKELIKESLDTKVPILALNSMKENSLREKSMAYFGEELNVIHLEDLKSYKGKFLIDDLDEVISEIFRRFSLNDDLEVSGAVVNI